MDSVIATFGREVRRQRKEFGLNQQQLAELSGTSLNFVSQLERGKQTVQLNSVLAVLSALGLELHLQRGKQIISVSKDIYSED